MSSQTWKQTVLITSILGVIVGVRNIYLYLKDIGALRTNKRMLEV